MNEIVFVPAAVQIKAAIGASVAIQLNALKPNGAPFDLTPYGITAPFVPDDGSVPPLAGWAVAMVNDSTVHLSLTDADTATLAPVGRSVTWHWCVWLDHATAPERIMFSHGDLALLTP